MPKDKVAKKWYAEGIQFECQSSGNCCTSHGEYGHVYFSLEDRQLAAKALSLSTAEFTRIYCQKADGFWALKDNPAGPDCIFLKDKRCNIYKGRPIQCRTWPFWPEVMSARKWRKDVETFCPGINKGRHYSAQDIDTIVDEQNQNEISMNKERK